MGKRGAVIGVVGVVCAFACGLGCGLDGMGLAVGDDGGSDEAGFDVNVPPAVDAGGAQGSGTDDSGGGGATDATPPSDAAQSPDGPDGSLPPVPIDAGCSGVVCNGQCTSATDCRACSGAGLLCRDTQECVADCSSCKGLPIACYACDSNRQNPIGTCEAQNGGTYCLDTNYAGAYLDAGQGYHCGCTTAADCPGEGQVCMAIGTGPFACFTCGEGYTQALTCKSGGSCNAQQDRCNGP
jgi:hypothetical protein